MSAYRKPIVSLGKTETELTPAEITAALAEASSTRWPIAVSLVDREDGLTVTQLAQIVGRSISWTLKQAKAMEEKKILEGENSLLDLPRGRIYKLVEGGSEVVKQCKEYDVTRKSLERRETISNFHATGFHRKLQFGEKSANDDDDLSIMERLAGIMMHDANVAIIRYGFIPVKVIESSDGVKYEPIDEVAKAIIVADTFPEFGEVVLKVLGYSGESAQTLQTLPQTDQSE